MFFGRFQDLSLTNLKGGLTTSTDHLGFKSPPNTSILLKNKSKQIEVPVEKLVILDGDGLLRG